MTKREAYAVDYTEPGDTCKVFLLLPRTVIADHNPPPEEELERIREEVAQAARQTHMRDVKRRRTS